VVCDSLYSCLANGSADEFQKGEQLFKSKSVSNALQIGKYVNVILIEMLLVYNCLVLLLPTMFSHLSFLPNTFCIMCVLYNICEILVAAHS